MSNCGKLSGHEGADASLRVFQATRLTVALERVERAQARRFLRGVTVARTGTRVPVIPRRPLWSRGPGKGLEPRAASYTTRWDTALPVHIGPPFSLGSMMAEIDQGVGANAIDQTLKMKTVAREAHCRYENAHNVRVIDCLAACLSPLGSDHVLTHFTG